MGCEGARGRVLVVAGSPQVASAGTLREAARGCGAVASLLRQEGSMQKSLKTFLNENYPNLEFVTNINEFKGAYQDKSVMYLIAETPNDGATFQQTALLPYSELALFSRVVENENHTSQNISIGHGGVIVAKEQNIVRGVVAGGNG